MRNTFYKSAVRPLKSGAVCVIPTDTLYGLVALAADMDAVERVYAIKRRDSRKPCIILISDIETVGLFGVSLNEDEKEFLNEYWPGPNSIILDAESGPEYLTRGSGTLAFRVPADNDLRLFLKETGPLVAPSANLEGMRPAVSVSEARLYFGDTVDLYIDAGRKDGPPSSLFRFEDGRLINLR